MEPPKESSILRQSLVALVAGSALVIASPTAGISSPTTHPADRQTESQAQVSRIAGENRYATAAQVAETWPAGTGTVYIASGSDFPDALTAASRAGSVNAPVLLTQKGRLPLVTRNALSRLDVSSIVVVGGTHAVSDQVREELQAYARSGNVYRVHGTDRYDTAAEVASKYPGGQKRVYLASGETFADALAAAALAGHEEVPLLLTTKDTLPSSTATELDRIRPEEVVVIGGPLVVSDAVGESAGQQAGSNYRRIAGGDRYETTSKVAAEFPNTGDHIYVASGEEYADALVGGALAARTEGPVLLTHPAHASQAALGVVEERAPSALVGIGGEEALATNTLETLAGSDQPPVEPPPTQPPGWELHYETDFSDLSGWQVRDETQSNDNSRNIPDNVLPGSVGSGEGLTILGKREPGYNRPFTSGEIHGVSDELVLPNYFRAEVVGRVTDESGIWPALLWFRPVNSDDGEIDVMEYMGGRPENDDRQRFAVTMHNEYGPTQDSAKGPIFIDKLDNDSVTGTHRYTIEKTPGQIKVWIDDDVEHASVFSSSDKDWWNEIMEAPGRTWYPRITLQVGAGSGKAVVPNPDASWSESSLEVDSLRVWTPDS